MRRLGALMALAAALAATATPARAAQPACTVAMAMVAIENNDGLVDDIRATGAVSNDEDIFDVFTIDTLFCSDLTGDGKAEMAAFLTCCTAASPTPLAIFRPRKGKWRLSYSVSRLLISSERRKGRKIILRSPVYRRTDPLCCPSSYRTHIIQWRNGKFRRTTRR